MMILLIDVGNSRIKLAHHRDTQLFALTPYAWRASGPEAAWSTLLAQMEPPSQVLVANVAGDALATTLNAWTERHWKLLPEYIDVKKVHAGMETRYEQAAQLGVDRWLAALAGFHLAHGAVGVVDVGTALTIDYVTEHGVHVGGLIAPGIELMLRALTSSTAQLAPEEVDAVTHFGTNTRAAISLGCREAIGGLIARTQNQCEAVYGSGARWYVTGGGADLIAGLRGLALTREPDLVLRGIAIAAGIA